MLDIVIGAILELRRQGMGGQAGAAHRDRQRFAKTADHPQNFAFTLQAQAITRLDLDTGHAIAQQTPQTLTGTVEQLVLAGRAGRTHSAGNTAAGRGDFGIAHALQTLLELTAAVAAKHRVRMAIDKPRRYPRAFKAVGLPIFARRQLLTRAKPLNVAVTGDEGGILDDRVRAVGHCCDIAVLPKGFHRVTPSMIKNSGKLGSHFNCPTRCRFYPQQISHNQHENPDHTYH